MSLLIVAVGALAAMASASTLGFLVSTWTNPYDDITRAWTMMFTLASGAASIVLWIAFWWLIRRTYEDD